MISCIGINEPSTIHSDALLSNVTNTMFIMTSRYFVDVIELTCRNFKSTWSSLILIKYSLIFPRGSGLLFTSCHISQHCILPHVFMEFIWLWYTFRYIMHMYSCTRVYNGMYCNTSSESSSYKIENGAQSSLTNRSQKTLLFFSKTCSLYESCKCSTFNVLLKAEIVTT